MMIGAWSAASIDSIRLRKMKGKGSNARAPSSTMLMTAQAARNRPKPMMKPQEPPTEATRSARRSPTVRRSAKRILGSRGRDARRRSAKKRIAFITHLLCDRPPWPVAGELRGQRSAKGLGGTVDRLWSLLDMIPGLGKIDETG